MGDDDFADAPWRKRRGQPSAKANGADNLTPLPTLALADIEPVLSAATIVKGLLGTSAHSVFFGDSNTAKSFLALDLAGHVALGEPWFGRKVQQGAAFYVAVEGANGLKNRAVAFRQHNAIKEPIPLIIIPYPVDLRSENADTSRVIETINSEAARLGCKPVLIVIDTLTRALAGGSDSDPTDMGAYLCNVTAIRLATKAHVLSVHHTGKVAERGARGHSSLRADTDTEIEISRDEKTGLSTASLTKQRDLPRNADPISYRLDVIQLGVDEDGDPVTSCVVVPVDGAAKATSPKKITGGAKQALELLCDAVAASGEPAPASQHIPQGVFGVTKTVWKGYCEKGGIINAGGNPREQLRRFIVTLKDADLIGVWDDFVWPSQRVT